MLIFLLVWQILGGSAKKKTGLVHWEEHAGGWAIRFPTANATVVHRTQSIMIENPNGLPTADDDESQTSNVNKSAWTSIKPVHYGCYFVQKSIVGVIGVFVIGCLLVLLSAFKFGQKLLIQYPEIFSLGTFHKRVQARRKWQLHLLRCGLLGVVTMIQKLFILERSPISRWWHEFQG